MKKTTIQTAQSQLPAELASLQAEASQLAQQLFKNDPAASSRFTGQLINYCAAAIGKDVLIMHNPGGWGSTDLDHLIEWENSIIEGMKGLLSRMGWDWVLAQYFRSDTSGLHLRDAWDQARYFFTGKIFKADVLAAELNFLTGHYKNLRIVLLGVSQGAAFGNTVMQSLGPEPRVYSLELGMFFAQLSRRVITERTLAIDSNGLVPDPIVHRNLKAGFKAYALAPFRWLKYRMAGKPVKYTHCINVPGHEYNWEYPNVGARIEKFLTANLGWNKKRMTEGKYETGQIYRTG